MANAMPLHIFEGVNMWRSDSQEDTGRAISLVKLGIPAIKWKTAGYAPAGGGAEVNFQTKTLEPIEPKFEMKGIDPDFLSKIGFHSGLHDKFTFAGAVRNKQTLVLQPMRCIIQGVVNSVEHDEYSAGELAGCNYALTEVVHFELKLNGVELFYFDFYTREGRSGGVSFMDELNNVLGG